MHNLQPTEQLQILESNYTHRDSNPKKGLLMSGEDSSGIEVLSFRGGPCRNPRYPAIGICLTLMLIVPKTSYHKLIPEISALSNIRNQ